MSAKRVRLPRAAWILMISVVIFGMIWAVSPWLYLSGLHVEAVRILRSGETASTERTETSGPERIRVSFTTTQDLAAYRRRWRLPFIQAGILACAGDAAGADDEVVTQGAGYLPDRGRVRALGRVIVGEAERYAYEAVFDNVLTYIGDDHEGKQMRASTVAGGLCFKLHGASLISGSVRSASIPLHIDDR